MPIDADMAAYYSAGREADRLTTWGKLERARTEVLLERYLPRAPARVLDVGGGPGIYAAWLGARGYDVALLDPIEVHVEQARAAGVGARVGDARSLPWPDQHADAVVMLGPLYHLPDASDRLAALGEARRVLRAGGVLVAAVISRYASTLDGLFRDFLADPRFEDNVERNLRTGCHDNPERVPGWFTTAYFHHPDELVAEIVATGLRLHALVGVEGPAAYLPDLDGRLNDPDRRALLLRTLDRIESERALLGASPHLIAVAQRT